MTGPDRSYSRRQIAGGAAALWATSLLPHPAEAAKKGPPKTYALLGKETPHFRVNKLGGGRFDSKDFANRYLLIDFWGLWCLPCIRNAPYVRQLALGLAFEPRVHFFGLHCGRERNSRWKSVAAFAKDLKLTYDIGFDPKLRTALKFKIPAFPSYVLVAPDRRAVLWRTSAAEGKWQALRDDVLAIVRGET